MQLILGLKNAETIAYELKGSSLYKKGMGLSYFVPGR